MDGTAVDIPVPRHGVDPLLPHYWLIVQQDEPGVLVTRATSDQVVPEFLQIVTKVLNQGDVAVNK